MKKQLWALAPLAVCLCGCPAAASVLHVPSEYPTIQAAVDAAMSGDEILLASGRYEGPGNTNVLIESMSLSIRSESGAGAARLVGPGYDDPKRGFELRLDPDDIVSVEGLAFEELRAQYGGAVLAEGGAQVVVEDCSLNSCGPPDTFEYGGGVIDVRSVREVRVERSTFSWNFGPQSGITAHDCDAVRISDCDMFFNGGYKGLIIFAGRTVGEVERCRIVDNDGRLKVGVDATARLRDTIIVDYGGVHITGRLEAIGCTIARAGGITMDWGSLVELDHSIVSGNCGGDFLGFGDLHARCSSLDSTGIADGIALTLEGDQVWTDPLFCDPRECGDISDHDLLRYWLAADSPCAPENSPCGELIGAYGIGCGAETGGCCVDTKCSMTTDEGCAFLGGRFLGVGTSCETDSCVPTPILERSWGQIKGVFR
ncbi:MAG: right-handed parallel beta-helix repeat-containing protein [Candidatus Eisenbacteria bacterium]